MTTPRTVNVFFSLHIPRELTDALADVQRQHESWVDPQKREHMHITLGFLHDADAPLLADAAALVSNHSWPTPVIQLTGEVAHGSWELQKDPAHHYRDDLIQKGEQIRLGIDDTPEITEIHRAVTEPFGIAEAGFRPHITLGLARQDLPMADARGMTLPTVRGPAPALALQQELSTTDFRILARHQSP